MAQVHFQKVSGETSEPSLFFFFFFFLTGQEYMVRIGKFLNIESPDMDWVILHNKSQMKLFAKINQKQYLIPRECATPDT